jgi:ComF family protein
MSWWQPILDCVFPLFCVDCKKEGEWWCIDCRARDKIQPFIFQSGSDLEMITALFKYQEHSPLASLIHSFKYQYTIGVAEVWQNIISTAEVHFPSNFTIIPIPLFIRRERERGFNQATILAGLFAERLQLPLSIGNLVRQRPTVQQAKLNREERFKNVASAFVWQGSERIPENIILVDDVYTTGATMSECARVLKAQGARIVRGLVLAHG